MTDAGAFQRESYRIDEQIWNALAVRRGERALFVGVANDGAWIARALEIGADVTVLAGDDAAIARIEQLGATPMRGSATMIGAADNAYDLAVAMHYLHEADPGFHRQVVAELARVARRVAIVEPSPPADPLGKRIAALYARAKRESGQFEGYQPLEYWRRLLSSVKGDVWQNLFTFTRVPSREAVSETVSLILDAMAIEAMPKRYIDELREMASRRDAQLLPLSRIVLVGIAAGEPFPQGSGSAFRPNITLAPEPPPQRLPAPAAAPAAGGPPAAPASGHAAEGGFGFDRGPAPEPGAGWDVPAPPAAVPAPKAPAPAPKTAPVPKTPPAPSGPPAAAGSPFGAPFALPGDEEGDEKTGFGWSWEPPEEDEEPAPPG
ncbi:MAG TPA: hypothetical protein VHT05_00875 [Candidatus Elarobacter sp.]|jgi:hypothetical protein|nr:hypothetical protein [Candidatus Elarobacter sp.]